MERPLVYCLMALPLREGEICRVVHLVTLEEADARRASGEEWAFIGPDPADWRDLEVWEAAQWPRPWSTW